MNSFAAKNFTGMMSVSVNVYLHKALGTPTYTTTKNYPATKINFNTSKSHGTIPFNHLM
jgi:hypothetical protein